MFTLRTEKGFTLIELMIVVAIIGILAAIAVPNFIAYRNKSRIAAGISTAESVRGALAGYAAISSGNTFPQAIAAWGPVNTAGTFANICNANGATLGETMLGQGFTAVSYSGVGSDGDEGCNNATPGDECADYVMVFQIAGAPGDLTGAQIELRSAGIQRQTWATAISGMSGT